MEQQVVPCLGRPMTLGMLYDCRSDTLVPGVALWNKETIQKSRDIYHWESSDFEITANDSIESKAHLLNLSPDVKISFLSGLLSLGGAAKYLDNNHSSTYQARVVLKYSCKTGMEKLTMNHLDVTNIEHQDILETNMATHVITAVEYGADAIFVFDRKEKNYETCRKVELDLQAHLSKLNIATMDTIGSVLIHTKNKTLTSSFTCTFHGDVILKENPITFEDALKVYKELPELIRKSINSNTFYGVPKRAYLYPLCKLDGKPAKLMRSICNNIVNDIQSIVENIDNLSATANELENSEISHKFPKLKQQVAKFKSLLVQFRCSFQGILRKVLFKIRGSEVEESKSREEGEGEGEKKLQETLRMIINSPYDIAKLDTWLGRRICEFSCLENYLEALKDFSFAFQPGELQNYTQHDSPDYVICISFGKIPIRGNTFLDIMEKFSLSKGGTMKTGSTENCEYSWCDDFEITADIRSKIRQFKDFAESNKDQENLKFIVSNPVLKRGKTTNSCSIILYSQKSCPEIYQLPGSPGKPEMVSNTKNEVTITWTAPTVGVKNVTSYSILYKPTSANDDKWTCVKTGNSKTQFTVKQLTPDTEYMFKVESICEIGKSTSGPVSSSMRTKTALLSTAPANTSEPSAIFPWTKEDLAVLQGAGRRAIINEVLKNCGDIDSYTNFINGGLNAVHTIRKLMIDSFYINSWTEEKSNSFRTSCDEISPKMYSAFQRVDFMDTIKDLLSKLQIHIENALNLVNQIKNPEIKMRVENIMDEIECTSSKCEKIFEDIQKSFNDVPIKGKIFFIGAEANWEEFLLFFNSIDEIIKNHLSTNITIFVKKIKEHNLDKDMLQAIVKVIGYCTAVSGYLDIYIKILQEHIIPIITEIKDEVPLDEKNIPKEVPRLNKKEERKCRNHTEKQMNIHADKIVKILSEK